MLKFSIKNVFRKKGVSILASTGIGVGLMLMFVLGAFNAGVSAQFQENFSKLAGIVTITQANRQGALSNLPVDTLEKMQASDVGADIQAYNVQAEMSSDYTLPYLSQLTLSGNKLAVIGVNKSIDQPWEGATNKIEKGRTFTPGAYEVIVDSRLKDVATFDVSVGTSFVLYLEGTLGGVKTTVTIVGVYTQEDSGAPTFVPRTYYMYMDTQVAWEIMSQANDTSNIYTAIFLRFPSTNNDDTQKYVDKINTLSEEGYFGLPIAAFSAGQFQEALQSTLSVLDSFILIISLITAIAGGMGIIVSQLMSVAERMKEFAILKSTGWKNSHIFKNVIYESLTLGVLGAFIGISLGYLLIVLLSTGSSPFGGAASAVVTPQLLLQVLIFALGIGVLGGLYPGLKAARVRPVVVLKGD